MRYFALLRFEMTAAQRRVVLKVGHRPNFILFVPVIIQEGWVSGKIEVTMAKPIRVYTVDGQRQSAAKLLKINQN